MTTKTENSLRPELTLPLPERMRDLPVHRGYLVPWFVAWPDGPDGEPEFRAADFKKWREAVDKHRCWVCGQRLGAYLSFVLGPMCGISRTTAEPACHRECAEWSILNCPFLSRPKMVRRENDLPEGTTDAPGEMLRRNPGVTLLWITRSFTLFPDSKGGQLIEVGDPVETVWYAEGRAATRQEVVDSAASGLPSLILLAREDGQEGEDDLARKVEAFDKLLPER